MKLKKCKKYVLLSSLLILVLLIFTACGAVINTEMSFNKDFKGERILTAFVKSSDIRSYVPTGADGIEEAIKKYIPESMTYKRIDKESNDVEFIFSINFNDLEDYTKKVTQILNKNPDNTIQASILYDNKNNEFKKNVLFEENFSSKDLLAWLAYALKTENIVNDSNTSNWMEIGTSSLKIENQDYDVYGNFQVKESESTSFDKINVLTEILENGKLKRSITFLMDEKNVKILEGRGIIISEYLKKLSPENSYFEESKEDKNIKYLISFESETFQELSSNTDKLFNSQNSIFAINYSSYDDSKNSIKIDVNEYIDASYYLDYDSNKLKSDIYLYENMFVDFKNADNEIYENKIDDRSVFSYNPNFHDAYKFTFSLPIKFQNVSLYIDVNKDKMSEKLTMSLNGKLPNTLTEIIEGNIKSSIESEKISVDMKKEENAITYILSLTASPGELSNEFKRFLLNYTGNNLNHEMSYTKLKSKSIFKTQNSLNIDVDLFGLNAEKLNFYCKPSPAKSFEILKNSNIELIENSKGKSVTSELNGSRIRFYALEVGINWISVIISVILIVILILILWYAILQREKIKTWFRTVNKNQGITIARRSNSSIDSENILDKSVTLTDTSEENTDQDEDEFI